MAVVQKLDPENEAIAKDMLKALENSEEINKKIESEFSDTSNTWQGDAADKFKESVNTYVKEADKAIETCKEAVQKILNAQDAKKEDQKKAYDALMSMDSDAPGMKWVNLGLY